MTSRLLRGILEGDSSAGSNPLPSEARELGKATAVGQGYGIWNSSAPTKAIPSFRRRACPCEGRGWNPEISGGCRLSLGKSAGIPAFAGTTGRLKSCCDSSRWSGRTIAKSFDSGRPLGSGRTPRACPRKSGGWNCGFPLSRERRVGADFTGRKDFATILGGRRFLLVPVAVADYNWGQLAAYLSDNINTVQLVAGRNGSGVKRAGGVWQRRDSP